MRYHIFTFGCQMNVCDSWWLDRALKSRGFIPAAEEEADFFILNTCSVREKPEQKVYSLLGRLQEYTRERPHVFAAVGGCVAQQVGRGFLKRFPFVRLVFGTDGLVMAPDALYRLASDPGRKLSLLDFSEMYPEREQALPEHMPAQAFVNIMQGCDNFCAYCIVPYTRGRQKSRASGEVLRECREMVEKGAKEITLLGQNVNSYGRDKYGDGTDFATLLYMIAEIPGLRRLRFTTSHPKDIAPEVIRAFGDLPVLCPHLHLPVQSGSDRVLKAMGRKYDRDSYLRTVDSLRRACPDISLTTDIIVGFPGETEEDFLQTMDLIRRAGFESSFSFKYCDRPGVRACRIQPKVEEEIKSERLARLQKLQEELSRQALNARVGGRATVLVETRNERPRTGEMQWRGRDGGNRVVNIAVESAQDLTGKEVEVKIIQAKKHSLIGEVLP
jgi:tRNA-2-methylthio-N6-dimethylallyladenosine synthase